jgi:hypothetical protein
LCSGDAVAPPLLVDATTPQRAANHALTLCSGDWVAPALLVEALAAWRPTMAAASSSAACCCSSHLFMLNQFMGFHLDVQGEQ